MIRRSALTALAICTSLLCGCGNEQQTTAQTAGDGNQPTAGPESETQAAANAVEIRAVGMTFEGPSEIPSGWTTFRFVNASGMIHFALIDVPPQGVTLQMMSDLLMQPFQEAMDGMNAGDEQAVNAAFAKFPEWIGGLSRQGGPGFLSPGLIGQTTVYLEPGHYILECYVKSDGVFHTTSPGEGQIGMMLDLMVTDQRSAAPEPEADVVVAIRNSGFEILSGSFEAGTTTVRVNFEDQQALPSFVGNDVHLMRVEDEGSIALAGAWLDWRSADGLEDPSPVTFLGGINDMPAGTHGYFTVDLEPGEYALIAEMPDPLAAGFVLPFSVE